MIAAAIIGGTAISGGTGTVPGALLGALVVVGDQQRLAVLRDPVELERRRHRRRDPDRRRNRLATATPSRKPRHAGTLDGNPEHRRDRASRRLAMYVASNISRQFGGVRALDGVDLDIRPGEVQGLLGANGAGKSTLVKILVGADQPTEGTLTLAGTPVRFADTEQASAQGVSIVTQELNLFPDLDVRENLFLLREPRYGGHAGEPARDAPPRPTGARGGRAARTSGPPRRDAAPRGPATRRDRARAARPATDTVPRRADVRASGIRNAAPARHRARPARQRRGRRLRVPPARGRLRDLRHDHRAAERPRGREPPSAQRDVDPTGRRSHARQHGGQPGSRRGASIGAGCPHRQRFPAAAVGRVRSRTPWRRWISRSTQARSWASQGSRAPVRIPCSRLSSAGAGATPARSCCPDGRPGPRTMPGAVRRGLAFVPADRKKLGVMLEKTIYENIAIVSAGPLRRMGMVLRRVSDDRSRAILG